MKNGVKVSQIKGNYMGYLDFDGVRYWDLREQFKYEVDRGPMEKALKSDSRNRIDSLALLAGTIEQAQLNKEELEKIQRSDRKRREEAEKRRENGGAKYKYTTV